MMKQKNIREPAADIGRIVRRMQPVMDKAEALGIFTNDRELLECPNCGLKEDVLIYGQLITYKGDAVQPDCGSLKWIMTASSALNAESKLSRHLLQTYEKP